MQYPDKSICKTHNTSKKFTLRAVQTVPLPVAKQPSLIWFVALMA